MSEFDLDLKIQDTEKALWPIVCNLASRLHIDAKDIVLTGGAVRDCFVGNILGKQNLAVKDFDIILPKKPNLKNIANVTTNSFGGLKINIDEIGCIDIFHKYTTDVQGFIANNFDFNCNSIYFSGRDGKLYPSAYFYHFLETSQICVCCGYNGIPEQTMARALKFKVMFADKFDLNVSLHTDLLLYALKMTEKSKHDMFAYINKKNKDAIVRNKIIMLYKSICQDMK